MTERARSIVMTLRKSVKIVSFEKRNSEEEKEEEAEGH